MKRNWSKVHGKYLQLYLHLLLYFIALCSGICSNNEDDPVRDKLDVYLNPLSKAYKEICNLQTREFFGLRDFYR